MGGRPVRIARVAVKDERAGFQGFFEFFSTKRDGLIVIVRTNDFEVDAFTHVA